MPGKLATDGSNSKWTRMWWSNDMAHFNVRREHLAHIWHYKVNIDRMKRLARLLGRPITILDVGCGEANTPRLFYSSDQSRKRDVVEWYVGIDGDPGVISKTAETAATVLRGLNGEVQVCDITKGRFDAVERGSVDLIICNEVLEHIPQDKVKKVLKAMHRATHGDSVIIISTPNKDGTNDKLPADHVYEWGFEEIQEAYAAAGFEVVEKLGVYIKKDRLKRWIRENDPELEEWAMGIWEDYGLDLGSMMTAHLAPEVANNCIWILRQAS